MNYKYNVILLSALWEEISQMVVQVEETQAHTLFDTWIPTLRFECKINNEIHDLEVMCKELLLARDDFIIKMKLYEIQHWFLELLAKDNRDKALAVSYINFLKME